MSEKELLEEILRHQAGYTVLLFPLCLYADNDEYIVQSDNLRRETYDNLEDAVDRFIYLRQLNELGKDYDIDQIEDRHY